MNERHETDTVVDQFQQLIDNAARNRPSLPEHGSDPTTRDSSPVEEPLRVGFILDYVHDPLSIPSEIWDLIDRWSNNERVRDWLKLQSKEGERKEYGIVYDVVQTISQSGVVRTEVKFIDVVGFGGFVYSTTSGNPDIKKLQLQEPNGFKKGDLVETTSNGNVVVSRKRFSGSQDDELKIRLDILHSSKTVIQQLLS